MLTPIGRDIDICLKCLNWSMDNKKASGIWTDQTRNQICTQSLPNMRPSKGKKMLEGKSKITWIHYRRPEIQAQFDSDHKIWQ